MKNLKDIIIEKLKVSSNTDLHICQVELDPFIPWIYDVSFYRINDLVPNDLVYPFSPFKDILKKDFNNDPLKLYEFFVKQVNENPIIDVESIEDYPGAWEFEFILDGITFKTHKKYKYPLDEWKKIYPYDGSLNFFVD